MSYSKVFWKAGELILWSSRITSYNVCYTKLLRNDRRRVYEVQYQDLLANPVETAIKIYERFGLSVPREFESTLVSYLQSNPQHKHGMHSYSLEEFGISEAALQELDQQFSIWPSNGLSESESNLPFFDSDPDSDSRNNFV